MKIIISGGGTAGHTHPALAIGEKVAEREGKENVLFVLRSGGRENVIIEKRGFNIEYIDVAGLKRSLSFKNIATLTKALRAKERCKRLISDFKPDAVLGTGGYVCWPLISAAVELKVKSALHESNAVPGLATRLLAPRCDLVMTNFKSSEKYFPKVKTKNTGNPLLSEFGLKSRESARASLGIPREDIFVLSVGGSLGARRLNEVVSGVMDKLSDKYKQLTFIHSTGEANRDQIKTFKTKRLKMVPYIENMAAHLAACDIVISRCGAITLSEIALTARAAILVPSPNVTGNHQYKNAKELYDANAALMIEEKELDEVRLQNEIERLISDKKLSKRLSIGISSYSRPDAAALIYESLKAL